MTTNNHQQITRTREPAVSATTSSRAEALAVRLEQGAAALAALASTLSDAEWQTCLPRHGRKIGVVVHHVASMYPLRSCLLPADRLPV